MSINIFPPPIAIPVTPFSIRRKYRSFPELLNSGRNPQVIKCLNISYRSWHFTIVFGTCGGVAVGCCYVVDWQWSSVHYFHCDFLYFPMFLTTSFPNFFLCPASTFFIEGVLKKTYFARVDRSAQKPRNRHLFKTCCSLWSPLVAVFAFAGGEALLAVCKCPWRHKAGRLVFEIIFQKIPILKH